MKKGYMIKKLRLVLELSQLEFSKMLGITQAHLSYMEAGKRTPSFKVFYKIRNLAKLKGIIVTLEEIVAE